MQVNEALSAKNKYQSDVEQAAEYIENFDILETITNVGNDEVFTPIKVCNKVLDMLPIEVWSNPDYKWLNPVDKNGVFHREIALRLDHGLSGWQPDLIKRRMHILQNMLFSIGLTKFTSEVARRTLYYCSVANRSDDGLRDKDGHSINGYAIGNGDWFNDFEGNIKKPITKHQFKKGKCVFCGIREDSKYNDQKQIEHYAYEFIHKKQLLTHLQERFFNGDNNMKFDIIIGNPPYQLNDNASSNSASPIYHKFVQQAISLNPRFVSMIIPSRWMAGGKGLDDFRMVFLGDKRIAKLVDFTNAKEVFPNLSIAGGVCYFLWDINKKDKFAEIENYKNGKILKSRRNLDDYDVFVRDNEAISILEKIRLSKNFVSLSSIISSRNPFGVASNIHGSEVMSKNNDLTVYSSKGVGYLARENVSLDNEYIDNYKVMISKTSSEHANEPDSNGQFKVLSVIRFLNKGEICTDSYLINNNILGKEECLSLINYLKTRFVRFLLLQSLTSVSMSKQTFRFVPIVDFSLTWTDEKLFKLYNFDQSEINYILSIVKEMV